MLMLNKSISAYSDIELTTEVMSASPHRLVQMLYEKFLHHMEIAKNSMGKNKEVANTSIKKASDIVAYLRECLKADNDETRKVAEQLDSSYVIVEKCLLNATIKKDKEYLDIAAMVIANIKSGWDQIGSQVNQP